VTGHGNDGACVGIRAALGAILALGAGSVLAAGSDWELRRDDLCPERPPVEKGAVAIRLGEEPVRFPRYLNELGVERIRISFDMPGSCRKKLSIVWSGGSQGPDRFDVLVDDEKAGASRTVDTTRRPNAWHGDDFACQLRPGNEHTIELRSPAGFKSPIEFAGIRLAGVDAGVYQPPCYESIGTLARYENEIGGKGSLIRSDHVWVFAPAKHVAAAKALAAFLEKAYAEMRTIYGMDTVFLFSVEHYPKGHKRGWGGISGAGTIGYTFDALEKYARLRTRDVNGFVGYTEEMSHGFKAYYRCDGTYEALGVAVQEDVVRRLVPARVADAFWLPEHAKWRTTHEAYLKAGRKNPDPATYPWGVLYTRILNDVFLQLRSEYGPAMWRDFFRVLREKDYPLHRATNTQRMGVYADIFSTLFKRDMRKEFNQFGIDLDVDPPWGWETYKK
jgi:hypothetical protein